MFFTASERASLYADCADGNAVHTPAGGGAPTSGAVMFHAPGSAVLGSQVMVTDYAITYRKGAFPTMRRGDTVVFDGVTYQVREAEQSLFDGLEIFVTLVRP